MTRIEEIEKASLKYRKSREECGVKSPILLDEVDDAFFMGAIWADKHTIHYNAQEMEYVLHKGVEQGKKEMLDKVCELLYAHNQKMAKIYGAKDVLSCADYTINVDELKKAM